MAQGKENIRFAEVERLLDEYFSSVIAPIMKVTKNQLAERQVEEMKEYAKELDFENAALIRDEIMMLKNQK